MRYKGVKNRMGTYGSCKMESKGLVKLDTYYKRIGVDVMGINGFNIRRLKGDVKVGKYIGSADRVYFTFDRYYDSNEMEGKSVVGSASIEELVGWLNDYIEMNKKHIRRGVRMRKQGRKSEGF